jgi:hypothetical protein
MAKLRKLGGIAQMLLQQHMQKRQMEMQSELVKQRQMEMAQYNDDLRRKTAEDQRNHSLLTSGLQDPTQFAALDRAGISLGDIDPSSFQTPDRAIMGGLQSKLGTAKREDLPTDIGLEGQLADPKLNPWDHANNLSRDPRAVKDLMVGRDSRKTALDEIDVYNTDLKGAESFATAYNTEMGQEKADATNAPAQLTRKQNEFRAMTPLEVQRESAKAWATLPAELEKLKQARTIELMGIGDKVQAEQVAQKSAAVKGLMPVYMTYRQLVLDVTSSKAAAGSPAASAALGAAGHIPVIGGVADAGLKAAHTATVSMFSPELGKKIGELNRLTQTLAQGMANAVLGNRGQTTENDRRTAENILATSFTDAETAADLLKITDRMFMILPTVTAQIEATNPNATAAEIIQAAADRAKQEAAQAPSTPAAQQTPAQPATPARLPGATIGPAPANGTASERLRRLKGLN